MRVLPTRGHQCCACIYSDHKFLRPQTEQYRTATIKILQLPVYTIEEDIQKQEITVQQDKGQYLTVVVRGRGEGGERYVDGEWYMGGMRVMSGMLLVLVVHCVIYACLHM